MGKTMDKKKILLVDDEVTFTRTLKLLLERTGKYEVRVENKGRHTVAAVKEFKPHLVLLDVVMPDADGGAIAHRLKSDPLLKDIPVIFLTATVSRREAGSKGTERGGLLFLAKPVEFNYLIECIEGHIQPSQTGVQNTQPQQMPPSPL